MTTWMLMLQLILPVPGADVVEAASSVVAAAESGLHADTSSTLRYRGIEAMFSKFRGETAPRVGV